jgi:hypothetical protein
MGVSACRRVGVSASCSCSWGGCWFLGAQRSGREPLAVNLLICCLIDRLPPAGFELETPVGVYHHPAFSETMNIRDVYMSKRRHVAPVLEWGRLRADCVGTI